MISTRIACLYFQRPSYKMSNPGHVIVIESLVGLVSSSIVAMSSVVMSCPRSEICPGLGVMSETGVLQAWTSLDAVGLLLLLLHASDHVVVVVVG